MMISVTEVMSTDLITLSEANTLSDARQLMHDKRIRHIPILDEKRQLSGLISHRDILACTMSRITDMSNERLQQFEASVKLVDVMVRDVKSIGPEINLRSAALFMEKHNYGCLPVLSDNKLIGIITSKDFIGVAINLLEQFDQDV